MIGHALSFTPPFGRPNGVGSLDRGGICGWFRLLRGRPLPGVRPASRRRRGRRRVLRRLDLFTLAALLELRESTLRLGRWAADSSWWSAAVQLAGTLLFNLTTFEAMQHGLSAGQEKRLIWAPNFLGSAAFLVSGLLAYRVANQARAPRAP